MGAPGLQYQVPGALSLPSKIETFLILFNKKGIAGLAPFVRLFFLYSFPSTAVFRAGGKGVEREASKNNGATRVIFQAPFLLIAFSVRSTCF